MMNSNGTPRRNGATASRIRISLALFSSAVGGATLSLAAASAVAADVVAGLEERGGDEQSSAVTLSGAAATGSAEVAGTATRTTGRTTTGRTTTSRGPRGPRGYRGYRGVPGEAGPAGPAGPSGPSGAVDVLKFSAMWSPATIPGNNGVTVLKPAACTTATHVAGAGETAVITMSATASPNPYVNDTLYLHAMYAVDGGSPQFAQEALAADSMSDGIANVSTQAVMKLEAGHTYQFRLGLASNSTVQVPSSNGACQGHVLVVRAGS